MRRSPARSKTSGTEHIVNLSIRTVTSPGAATLIAGFVVTGTSPKQVLIRAAGPALAGARSTSQAPSPIRRFNFIAGMQSSGKTMNGVLPPATRLL